MNIAEFESLKYFEEEQAKEMERMREYNNLIKYQEFKAEMLKYEDFTEEELIEMWEAEMLVEQDL